MSYLETDLTKDAIFVVTFVRAFGVIPSVTKVCE
jgi:hypothetical protein